MDIVAYFDNDNGQTLLLDGILMVIVVDNSEIWFHFMTFFEILQHFTTFFDISQHFTTFFIVCTFLHFTRFYSRSAVLPAVFNWERFCLCLLLNEERFVCFVWCYKRNQWRINYKCGNPETGGFSMYFDFFEIWFLVNLIWFD